ncbi:unnamed protein product [marine sediment metagenome]|uniref:Uncharacterized protein n=1 Tax=marine sediment metagenome TaxID=412755 RepID=X1IT46_9ZZZZ
MGDMIHNPDNPLWIDYAIQIVPKGKRNSAKTWENEHGNYFPSDTDGIAWDTARELAKSEEENAPVTALMIAGLIRQPQKDAFVDFGSDIPGGVVYMESDGWTIESVLSEEDLHFVPETIDGEEIEQEDK